MAPRTTTRTTNDFNEMMNNFDKGKGSWLTRPALVKLNLLLLMPLLSSGATGFDASMMNGLQSLPQWQSALGYPAGAQLGILSAIGWIGAILLLPLVNYVNERFGRKKTLLVGIAIVAVGAIIQTASQNFGTFLTARLFVGVASFFMGQPSPTLITELAYPTHRAKMTSLYQCLFYVGAIVAAWSTYASFRLDSSWAWRVPSVLQAFLPAIQLLFYPWCPESPRWLYAHGRVAEARAILVKYHGDGDENSPLVEWEMNEMSEAIESEKVANRTSWKALVDTPGGRHRIFCCVTLAFMSQWTGNGVVSYYFTIVLDQIGITNAKTQTLINGIFQLFNFFCAVAAAMSVDKLGRRLLLLWASIGMLISLSCVMALSAEFAKTGKKGYGTGVLAFIFIFFFHYDIAFTPLAFAYPAEIMPYAMRNKAMTIIYASTGVAIIFNLFVNPIGLVAVGWKFYGLYVALLSAFVVNIYLAFPETKGHSLEQIGKLFDKNAPADEYPLERNDSPEEFKADTGVKYTSTVEHHEVV